MKWDKLDMTEGRLPRSLCCVLPTAGTTKKTEFQIEIR